MFLLLSNVVSLRSFASGGWIKGWTEDARFVKYFCSGELMKGEENFLLYRDG